MKFALFVPQLMWVLFSLSNPSFAQTTTGAYTPKVGDYATYSMQAVSSGIPSLMSNEYSVTALDANAGTASVRQKLYLNGILLIDQTNDQLITSLLYPSVTDVANCASQGTTTTIATIETIRVKAGSFKTCHLKSLVADSDGNFSDLYVGNVPFGFVKSTQNNPTTGDSQSSELASYRKFL